MTNKIGKVIYERKLEQSILTLPIITAIKIELISSMINLRPTFMNKYQIPLVVTVNFRKLTLYLLTKKISGFILINRLFGTVVFLLSISQTLLNKMRIAYAIFTVKRKRLQS